MQSSLSKDTLDKADMSDKSKCMKMESMLD